MPQPGPPGDGVRPLLEPAEGLGTVVERPAELLRVARLFAAGSGPVAVDAERASGYRYGQATFLVQMRRLGAGTALIDPVALPDLSPIDEALRGVEYVLHAASQDLPGLHEHGLAPDLLFDTELASRLLGLPRVGLATVVADLLGRGLAKAHSSADWSVRPLPPKLLRYAALDVEVLIELREVLERKLDEAGKLDWARQEFEAVRTAEPAPPRPDPWRRTSGISSLRTARQLAVARSLWLARDRSARNRDIAPRRVLPDAAIIAAATALPRNVGQLIALPEFAGQYTRRRAAFWQRAIDEGLAMAPDRLPSLRGTRLAGPPQPRQWAERDPAAAERLAAARACLAETSQRWQVPVENLLLPDLVRRLCWCPPEPTTPTAVTDFLTVHGARPWQVELLAPPLAQCLRKL